MSFTYYEKWVGMQLFPLLMTAVLLLGAGVSNVVDAIRGHARCSCCMLCAKTGDVLVGGVFTVLYYTYFTVVRRSLDVFACTPGAGGVSTLNADPSISCWVPGGVHAALVPRAATSLVVYGAGVPAAIGFVLWRFRAKIRADQRLWLMGRGDNPTSNPQYSVRRQFAKLYQVRIIVVLSCRPAWLHVQDYRPDCHIWRLVLLMRKFLLVCITGAHSALA